MKSVIIYNVCGLKKFVNSPKFFDSHQTLSCIEWHRVTAVHTEYIFLLELKQG
jgi:hypothetical protein